MTPTLKDPIPTLFFLEGGWCEALQVSYQPGPYRPKTQEEHDALAPFASPLPEPGLKVQALPRPEPSYPRSTRE